MSEIKESLTKRPMKAEAAAKQMWIRRWFRRRAGVVSKPKLERTHAK